jgi:tetratricopeptide (TPR) repeat protein
MPLLVVLVSAAPLPNAEQLLRQGNEAFERGQSEEALRLFEQAEDATSDPALVAFNKAAALYRLDRFGEAALHYQRCLEDDSIPAQRRSLAYFQMGNAYLRDSRGTARVSLEKALGAYRACLRLEQASEAVRADARHNLELARLLWLKAVPNPEDPPRNDEQNPKNAKPMSPQGDKNDSKNGKNAVQTGEQGTQDAADSGNGATSNKSKKASSGPLTSLPDTSELVALSPQETEAHLDSVAQRILNERRHYRRHAVTVPENVKDW